MATYYVRTDGSDTNAGTGPATNQAWQTITKAIGATGIAPGDTLYIAPGIYRGNFTAAFTNPASEGQRVVIAGNPTASQFSGISAGPVVITNFASNSTITSGDVFALNKDYVTVQDICFTGYNAGGAPYYNIWASTAVSLIMTRCLMYQPASSTEMYFAYFAAKAGGVGANISRCVFLGGGITLQGLTHSGTWNSQTTVTDSIFINQNTFSSTNNAVRLQSQTSGQHGGVKIINCYLSAGAGVIGQSQMSTTHPSLVQNCLIEAPVGISALTNNGQITQSYNVIQSSTPLTNVASSGTTITNGFASINGSISKIQGWADYPFISALTSVQAGINGGINTNSLAADIYGTSWLTPTTPTIGASEFASYTPSSQYLPTERNASTITIAPGSTSQSIELYLGATGLAFNTSGLQAYYIRNRSAPVAITLVTQTATGAWTSGGFAEISSSLTPGVYRLDVPDAAFAAGASDVTIVVRGASGTNGAVVTVTLSAGGLTAAQTADAVLDAVASTHNNIGSIGAFIQDKTGYSLSTSQTFNTTGSVGSVAGNVTGNVTGTVGGVVGNIVGNLTGSVGTVAAPDNIIDGVWDEQRVGHTASGSFGEKLQTNAMADEMLARDLGSGLNAGTAEERTVRSALRALRNKVNVGSSQMVVKKEDDTTDAWTASVTTTAVSSNVSGIDPN